MKNIRICLLALVILTASFFYCTSASTNLVIQSPDGHISLNVGLQQERPYYTVYYKNSLLLKKSYLGFKLDKAPPLVAGFKMRSSDRSTKHAKWQPVWGENAEVAEHYHELKIYLQQQDKLGRKMNLVFRVFNDGVGFRYEIPEQEHLKQLQISDEITQFNFGEDLTCWWIPANYDSYEQNYSQTPLSQIKAVNTPVTMKSSNNCYVSLHEANLTNYPGMTLKREKDEPFLLHCDLVPWPDGIKVKAKTTMISPWRTIQISDSAAGLIESNLIVNLNEPCQLQDTSWITPMKYIGIWWAMHIRTETWHAGPKHGATSKNAKKYLDFAAAHQIGGVLVEGWNTGWDKWGEKRAFDMVTPYPDFNLAEVSVYGQQRGVQLIGHHETGGDAEFYEEKLAQAFKLYQENGIRAVKTGYAGKIRPAGHHHHGQWMVNHYRKVVETAARYRIMLDVHEPIKPTGIRRTFPNMMTREGVRGMEYNAWSEGNSPKHTCIVPFTRMLAGPLDYTPGVFDLLLENTKHLRPKPESGKKPFRVHTTLAKQLALWVVLYSPLQMASDLIENYQNQPAFAFFKQLPAEWQKSVVINGEIADFITIARKAKAASDWFMGCITDEHSRRMDISLNFLDKGVTYRAVVYADGEGAHWQTNPNKLKIYSQTVTHQDKLILNLAPGGGAAVAFLSE